MWLSFGGVKSQNEFATAELSNAKFHAMVAELLENIKISWKVDSPGRFRAFNRPRVLVGANFTALRRASFHFTLTEILENRNFHGTLILRAAFGR